MGFAAVFAVAAAGAYYYPKLQARLRSAPEATQPGYQKADLEFEKTRKHAASKEENRELISSQHMQVKTYSNY